MPLPDHILTLSNVTKTYRSPSGVDLSVLKRIDLTAAEGEALAIVGPSGSGKSTLLNIMGTLDTPTQGSVHLDGENLLAVEEGRLAAIRNRKLGFVFQLHHLLPQCTVLENVLVPTLLRRNRDEVEERAVALLKRVGLGDRLHHRPGQVSGGERQRAAVVRALVNEPRILLADEPTGSLDRAASDALVELLVQLNREEQVTLVVVTHSMRVAERMGRTLELRDGVIAAQ